jgi:hypothetical protein
VKKGLTEEIVEKWGISRERFDKTH